jgi:hypothetical protein
MAKGKTDATRKARAAATTGDVVQQQLLELAEQLGTLAGSAQARAEGWLESKALSVELARIRDGAANLLRRVNRRATATSKSVSKKAEPAAARALSRQPVAAPGKRHRRPPPQERLDKWMGEPTGRQMGQKSSRVRRRGGRG